MISLLFSIAFGTLSIVLQIVVTGRDSSATCLHPVASLIKLSLPGAIYFFNKFGHK